MKSLNDSISSMRIKLCQSGEEPYAVVIIMTVWVKDGKSSKAKPIRVRRLSHKTGLEGSFVTEVGLMFDEIRRVYYKGVKKKKG